MLNFIALFLAQWLLKTTVFQQPGRSDPISKPVNEGAQLPTLFGDDYRVTIGFLIALARRRVRAVVDVPHDASASSTAPSAPTPTPPSTPA